jgi:hypothetical protein
LVTIVNGFFFKVIQDLRNDLAQLRTMVETQNQPKGENENSVIQSIKKNLTIDDDGTIYVNKDDLQKGFLLFVEALEDLGCHLKGIVKFRVKGQETQNKESFLQKFNHVNFPFTNYDIEEILGSGGIFKINHPNGRQKGTLKDYSNEISNHNSEEEKDCESHLRKKTFKYRWGNEKRFKFNDLPIDLDQLGDVLQKTEGLIIPGVTKSYFYHGSNGSLFPLVKKIILFRPYFTTYSIFSA